MCKVNISASDNKPDLYSKLHLNVINKHFDCPLLLANRLHDIPAPEQLTKPWAYKDIPSTLVHEFTYNNQVKVRDIFMGNDFKHSSKDWTSKLNFMNRTVG